MKNTLIRRTFPLLIIFLLIQPAFMAIAGGGGEPAGAPTAAPAGISRGGRLTQAFPLKISSLDPVRGNAFSSEGNVILAIYERLLRADETGSYVPELATSWEVTDDKMHITFQLRKNVLFHDGTAFNAQAAKFNLDRLMDPQDATQVYRLFTAMDSVDVVDEYTVRINLKQPSADIFTALAYKGGCMVSPAAKRQYGEDYPLHPVGTGPFKFVEWVPGDHVLVVKNDMYWDVGEDGKPLPYLDEILFRVINDDSVRLIELQTGNIDIMAAVPSESLGFVRDDPNLDLVKIPHSYIYRLYLNMRKPPFDNLKVRQAVNFAIDREAMAETLLPGSGFVIPFYILPEQNEYSDYTPYSYDPAKAKRLLAEAGYPSGLNVSLMLISREPDVTIAPVVQSYLEAIGIKTKIEVLERLMYVDRAVAGNFDMSMALMDVPKPSLQLAFQEQLGSNSPINRAAWKNSEFDALLEELSVTFDPEERKRIIQEMQKVCLDDAGQTLMFSRANFLGKQKTVEGYTFEMESVLRFHKTRIKR
jgi:peptide/nickel transport system substrate-binding protein